MRADGSSWNAVIERLLAKGVQVKAPPNPLRGISIDSAYIASFFDQTPGPILAAGPVSELAFSEPTGPPACKMPSWAVVA